MFIIEFDCRMWLELRHGFSTTPQPYVGGTLNSKEIFHILSMYRIYLPILNLSYIHLYDVRVVGPNNLG